MLKVSRETFIVNDHIYTLNYLNVPAVLTNFLITKFTSS